MLALEQTVHTASFQGANPVEKLTATDANLLSNLCSCKLAARRQSHSQQPFMRFDVFALIQRGGDGLGQVWSIQVIPLGHEPVYHNQIIVQLQTRIGMNWWHAICPTRHEHYERTRGYEKAESKMGNSNGRFSIRPDPAARALPV